VHGRFDRRERLASLFAVRRAGDLRQASVDDVAAGTGDWQEWRDAGATWWLRVLPWSRPVEESARTVESGPPGR